MRPLPALPLLLLVASVAAAEEPRLLIEGRRAIFRDAPGRAADYTFVEFRGGPELAVPEDPTCPARSAVQLAAVPDHGAIGFLHGPATPLPCEKWLRFGDAYLYLDAAGTAAGIRAVVYAPGYLALWALGEGAVPIPTPIAFAQLRFDVGAERFLARFYQPERNRPGLVNARPPSDAAARGERAFWQTLFGDDRADTALRELRRAVRQRPRDGRARFLLGMLHLYRASAATLTWADATPAAVADLEAAGRALDAALPLLWDGARGDSRVPGFAAVPVYLKGFLAGDPAEMQRGLDLIEDSVLANPIFNNFNLFALAPLVASDDPVYARIVELASDLLGGQGATCILDQPEICGSAGLAAHNTEAALTLLGDIFAKAGNEPATRLAYDLAAFGNLATWPHANELITRRSDVGRRVATYQTPDPTDDAPFLGAGAQACRVCHAR